MQILTKFLAALCKTGLKITFGINNFKHRCECRTLFLGAWEEQTNSNYTVKIYIPSVSSLTYILTPSLSWLLISTLLSTRNSIVFTRNSLTAICRGVRCMMNRYNTGQCDLEIDIIIVTNVKDVQVYNFQHF